MRATMIEPGAAPAAPSFVEARDGRVSGGQFETAHEEVSAGRVSLGRRLFWLRLRRSRGGRRRCRALDAAGFLAIGLRRTGVRCSMPIVLWGVALGVSQILVLRRDRPADGCSCCRRCCSPRRW